MKNQGYDQRVRLTKSMIKSAFLDLLSKKNVRHITVRELCEKAQINRATFYAHYMDIYDLKQQLENELLSSFSEVFAKSVAEADGSFSSEKMFAEVFSLLRKNSEQCVILLNSDAEIVEKFVAVSRDLVLEPYRRFFPDADEERLENYYLFVSTGCVALIKQWLLHAPDRPVEKVAEEVCAIVQKGIGCLQ